MTRWRRAGRRGPVGPMRGAAGDAFTPLGAALAVMFAGGTVQVACAVGVVVALVRLSAYIGA